MWRDRATPAQREQTLELLFETFEVSEAVRGRLRSRATSTGCPRLCVAGASRLRWTQRVAFRLLGRPLERAGL